MRAHPADVGEDRSEGERGERAIRIPARLPTQSEYRRPEGGDPAGGGPEGGGPEGGRARQTVDDFAKHRDGFPLSGIGCKACAARALL